MREDMSKVIVERPRLGGSNGRKGREEARRPDEDSASHAPLRQHARTKRLNENLSPLKRYLHAQVGRPWDRVYAEMRARIDGRNTVQQHILEHLEGYVAMNVRELGGVLMQVDRRWGSPQPLASFHSADLYVDPRTRLLRVNKWRLAALSRRAEPRTEADRRVLDAWTELQRIGGAWYEVKFEALAAGPKRAEVARFAVLPDPTHPRGSRASCHPRVACAKRQLARAELRAHGLDNGDWR